MWALVSREKIIYDSSYQEIGLGILLVSTEKYNVIFPLEWIKLEHNIDVNEFFYSFCHRSVIKKPPKSYVWNYFSRQRTVEKLFEKIYPNHFPIWIDDFTVYKNISFFLKQKEKHDVVIVQTEEDSFLYHDLVKLREKIANDHNWTEDSFIITNSYRDYEISKQIVSIQFKPGILDLICYRNSKNKQINFSKKNIKYHTNFIYQTNRRGRNIIFNFLKKYPNKIGCNYLYNYDSFDYFNKFKDSDILFEDTSTVTINNAPYVDINIDSSWSIFSCFLISYETFHHGVKSEKITNPGYYAPTLSEKTYKAMHLMRPALVFGGPGSRDYLRHFGFDTWDWMIDWSFDRETDYKKSLFLYLKELKRLLETDIEDLKDILVKNQDALEHNREQVFRLIKDYKNI